MPTVAIVDGVKILFYTNEHPPPHFHLRIAEHHAVMDIDTLEVTHGSLPASKRRKVAGWAKTRKAKLHRAFLQGLAKEPVGLIE